MQACKDCKSFVPVDQTHCPHCSAPQAPSLLRRFRLLLQLLLGASVTMTLAACYGTPPAPLPPCDPNQKPTTPCQSEDPHGSPSPSASASASPSASPSASASASAADPGASPSASAPPDPGASPASPSPAAS